MVNTLIFLGAIVCLIGGVMSIHVMRKQQNMEWDKAIDKKVLNNPVRSNPIVYAYWLFPIAVIVGAFLLGLYFKWWTGD